MAKILWQCNLSVFAFYIKTKDNWTAEFESRVLQPEAESSLSDYAFVQIKNKPGFSTWSYLHPERATNVPNMYPDLGIQNLFHEMPLHLA